MATLSETLGSIVRSDLDFSERTELLRLHHRPGALDEAAVCALFRGVTFETAQVLLIERGMGLQTHQGQVAFPGGSVDPEDQNDPIRTALRECEEEVGIAASSIQAIGILPTFTTLTGNFRVSPVLAILPLETVDLKLQASEVAHAGWVSIAELRNSRHVERRELYGVAVNLPVFWWGNRKVWGLTAWIFDLILSRYATLLT